MAENEQRSHIISYDIGEPRRLVKIHRYLKKRALPVQYSVFLIRCTPAMLKVIMNELEAMIAPAEDDIRSYTLPRKPEIITLGRQAKFAGMELLNGGENDYIQLL